MSYIGNSPITAAFLTDTFSGNGSTTAFTMSIAPAGPTSCIVAISGVVQDPSTYSTSGTTLTFSAAPPPGTNNISVRYLGIPASGVTTTAYRTVTEFTATAGQTSFSTPSYTVGFINVYRNGALLGTADYTATTGTTVVLATGATAGDLVVVESFYVSSVLNALPQTGGSLSGQLLVNGQSGQVPLIVQNNATEAMRVDASGNLGVGTSSPGAKLDVIGQLNATTAYIKGGGSSILYYDGALDVSRVGVGSQFGVDTSGNFKFASGYGSVATAYGCRAWVNWNGTGSSSSIRGSGNVSSVTDNGTGDYTINFTTALVDTNYTANFSISSDDNGTFGNNGGTNTGVFSNFSSNVLVAPTTSAVRVGTSWTGAGRPNPTYCCVVVFR